MTLAAMGHNFATGNHVIYLLWINRLRDPAYLAHDWYLSTPIMHPNIVRPLRYVCDWLGDANGFFAALALSRLLLVTATWRLARAIGASALPAGIAAFLAGWSPRVALGGHYPSGSFFDPSQMAMAMSALSLALLIERRYIWAGLWLGATIHVHLFAGVHLALIEALAVLFAAFDQRNSIRQFLANLSRVALPAFVLGAYTLIDAALGYFGSGGLSGRDVVEILAFRHPHHHSPLSWSATESLLFILCIMLGLTLARRNQRWRQPVFRALFVYGALAIIIGTIFVEWIPLSLVALFQFFRITALLMIWTCVEVGLYLAAHLQEAWSKRRITITSILATLIAVSFRSAPILLILSAILLVLDHFRANKALPKVRPVEGFLSGLSLPVLLSALGFMLILAGTSGWLNPLFARLGRPEFFRTQVSSPYRDVQELSKYLKTQTPPDAIILAPPGIEGLSLFSNRAGVVSFKQMTFTQPDLREWFDRVTAVSLLGRMVSNLPRESWGEGAIVLPHLRDIRRQRRNPQIVLDEGYDQLTADDVQNINKHYGASWFVAHSSGLYAFPKSVVIGSYTVYRIPANG